MKLFEIIRTISKMAFRLDNLKREYKNNEPSDVKRWFADNFDPETSSIYFAKYKFDDVSSVGFVRKNQVNGYYQQLDNKLHRFAFGQGLFQNGELTFVWVFSNKDGTMPQEMVNSSLYESCEWAQLDKDDEKLWDHFYPGKDVESYLFL